MRALRHIRPLLTTDAAKTIASAIIGARLDYCNSLLYASSARNLDRLQRVQNQLARVVLQLPWSASATDARRQLHWLPVTQRIVFKIETITYRARQSGHPAYLCSELEDYRPTRNSRSASSPLQTSWEQCFFLPVHFQFLYSLSGTRCSLGHVHLKLMPLSETD